MNEWTYGLKRREEWETKMGFKLGWDILEINNKAHTSTRWWGRGRRWRIAMCNQLVFVTTAEPLMSFSRCCCWWNCLFVFYCSYTVLVVVAVLVPLETMTRSEGQTILLPQLGMIVFRISQGNVWLKWYLRLFVVSKLGIDWGMGEGNTYYNNTTISQCGGNNSL